MACTRNREFKKFEDRKKQKLEIASLGSIARRNGQSFMGGDMMDWKSKMYTYGGTWETKGNECTMVYGTIHGDNESLKIKQCTMNMGGDFEMNRKKKNDYTKRQKKGGYQLVRSV